MKPLYLQNDEDIYSILLEELPDDINPDTDVEDDEDETENVVGLNEINNFDLVFQQEISGRLGLIIQLLLLLYRAYTVQPKFEYLNFVIGYSLGYQQLSSPIASLYSNRQHTNGDVWCGIQIYTGL